MRNKFGSTEAVHELLIDVQLQIGDPVPDPVDFCQAVRRCQRQGGTAQRAVADRYNSDPTPARG